MKRILLVLTVALVMAAMMMATALPAFAKHKPNHQPASNFQQNEGGTITPSGNINYHEKCTAHNELVSICTVGD